MTSIGGTLPVESGVRNASVRSTEASGYFETLKQKVVAICRGVFEWLRQSLTAGAFFVFRVVSYIYPAFGSKLEKGYLYVANFFNEYRTKDLKAEIGELNQAITTLVEQRNALAVENKGVIEERDALKIQNATLGAQNHNLRNEKERLLMDLRIAEVTKKELENANQRATNQETEKKNLSDQIENLKWQNQVLQKLVNLAKAPALTKGDMQQVLNTYLPPQDAQWLGQFFNHPQTM